MVRSESTPLEKSNGELNKDLNALSLNRSVSPDVRDKEKFDKLKRELLEQDRKGEDDKQLINVVSLGHVDAGKSTMMGHLLLLSGGFFVSTN